MRMVFTGVSSIFPRMAFYFVSFPYYAEMHLILSLYGGSIINIISPLGQSRYQSFSIVVHDDDDGDESLDYFLQVRQELL